MSPRKGLILGCALLLTLSFTESLVQAAEPPAAESPESVVRHYTEAIAAGQYLKATEFMHPEGLQKFRDALLPLLEKPAGDKAALRPFEVSDTAALKKLSPAEFFAGYISGLVSASPVMKATLISSSLTPIGSVPEGDLVHVVCRAKLGLMGADTTKMEVVTLKRSNGSWRVLSNGDLEGLAIAGQMGLMSSQ